MQGRYLEARTDLEADASWRFDPQRELRLSLSNLLREDQDFEVT